MATKREERKQRSEVQKQNQERQGRQRRWKSRALFVVGALALVAMGFMATRHRDGDESNGRVWSAAHGHWHDKATGLAR
jgi:hypothetical protein